MIPRTLGLILACLALPASASTDDWASWRGPSGDGHSASKSAPLKWDNETNVKWKVPLALPANGSPIVSGGRVFLTMPEDEDGKQRSLYCFDRTNGEELWVRTVDFGKVMPTHNTNPYGGSTPAADGERVIVWHASAGLFCYDYEGKELWKREFGEFRDEWGYGTSPLIHGDLVVLNTGPGERFFVTALDKRTGETKWQTEEPDFRDETQKAEGRRIGSWCTPIIVGEPGKEIVLCGQPTRVVAYDLASGAIRWTCDGITDKRGDLTYSSPVVVGDVAIFVGGWEGPLLGVRLGGEGDVTETHRVWRHEGQMSNCGSGIEAGGYLYVPDMRGTMWCVDPATGLPKWRERIGRGATWGSVVEAGGRLYLLNQKGSTIVFEPSPDELKVLAENELDEKTNATPAIDGGEIFLRTHEHLYCIAE